MWKRWTPVVALAMVLFSVNAVARLAVKEWVEDDSRRQELIGLTALAVAALVAAAAAFWWARRYDMTRVIADLGPAILAGCALTIFLGPYLIGETPMKSGLGSLIIQVAWYLAIVGGGGVAGLLLVMALGLDWKSQAWKRQERYLRRKPPKTVRR